MKTENPGLYDCPIRITKIMFAGEADSPHNVDKIIDWIGENRPEFGSLIQSLDSVVGMFNELNTDDFPESYRNFHMVKRALGGRPLPTVESLILRAQAHFEKIEARPEEIKVDSGEGINSVASLPTDGSLVSEAKVDPKKDRVNVKDITWLPLVYAKTLRRVSIMMRRGDKIAANLEERREGVSAIGYQNTATDTRTLVIASIFQVYEEMVKALPEFKAQLKDESLEPDRIIEALMEVSTEDLHLAQTLFKPLASHEGMNWVENSDRFSPEFIADSLKRIK